MLIDGFTVAAQLLNFLVLAWLLKRYLYRPVLDAIDAREARISAQIQAAQAQEVAAEATRQDFARRDLAFQNERAALLDQARRQAGEEGQGLLAAARAAADALSAQRQAALQAEALDLQQTLGAQVQLEVFEMAREALADLADLRVEDCIVQAFVRRLHALDAAARERLASALRVPGAPVMVRSAFALSDAQGQAIAAAIKESLDLEPVLHFENTPALLGGIELLTDGAQLAWSLDAYLGRLQQTADETLHAEAARHEHA